MPPRTPQAKTPQKRRGGAEPAKPPAAMRLRYEEDIAQAGHAAPRPVEHLVTPRNLPQLNPEDDLVFMAFDIVEEGPRFEIWGVTQQGHSVLLRVRDFQPYFYIAAPRRPVPLQPGEVSSGFEPGTRDELLFWDTEPQHAEMLRGLLNRNATSDTRIERIEPVHRLPIMYYRPDKPDGETYLRCWLSPGGNARKAGEAVLRAITGGGFKAYDLVWRDTTIYEHEVAPLQRFLADVPCSGGAWLHVPASKCGNTGTATHSSIDITTPIKVLGGASSASGTATTSDTSRDGFFSMMQPGERISTASIEVGVTTWRCITCLTPDAIQLADPNWSPFNSSFGATTSASSSLAAVHGAEAARRGDIAPLRKMLMDVCLASHDGKDRAPVPSSEDPIAAISCIVLTHSGDAGGSMSISSEKAQSDEDEHMGSANDDEDEDIAVAPTAAAVAGGPTSTAKRTACTVDGCAPRVVSFVLAGAHAGGSAAGRSIAKELPAASDVIVCTSEAELLLTWHRYLTLVDPDVLVMFQIADTLEAIRQRWAALRLSGGALRLSRHTAALAPPLVVKKLTMYSAAWVRSQSRMSSTSNQETFKAENTGGRAIIDLLRAILNACNLASFSMVDAVQSLLGETLEVLGAHTVATLAGIVLSNDRDPPNPLRLARYSLRRVAAVQSLLARLATIDDSVEMARVSGLTLCQVLYNAQMVRTWSLLLRVSGREGLLIPARGETSPLTEHTFILHPVETGTTGLHRKPVVILDFASLYPSIYRAYNLCYTTLLHPDDAANVPDEQVVTTPTGAKFVMPTVRQGILPGILGALISARATTRQQLRTSTDPSERAVLDSRQKSLKVAGNALYGFTGAQASPLQCVPVADSCLAYGAASCRRAREVLEASASANQLGPQGSGARVIYGHTDSLFVLLPNATDARGAIEVGQKAAVVVTAAFPQPMELKFERVCSPLLLLHVNRYAGRAYERREDVEHGGELIVKGLKSMWRQTAPILRTTLHGALVRIIMEDNVPAAVQFVQSEIFRLLSGKVSFYELVMTGGLWRVTGEQVSAAAAQDEFGGGGAAAAAGPSPAGAGAGSEEVRGPHAALAVKLTRRDPGRQFVLGERLQYVLTAGHRLQDEASEDPLTAARASLAPDLELYWKNKLQKPVAEVFAPCLTPAQLQELLNGAHTRVKVDFMSSSATGGSNRGGPSGTASPPPGKGKGRQLGMSAFFKANAKCLSCRQVMTDWKGDAVSAPGICHTCQQKEGKWGKAYLAAEHEAAAAEARRCAAHAACRACHTGLLSEDVLCENGECPVTYYRLSTNASLRNTNVALQRLDIF